MLFCFKIFPFLTLQNSSGISHGWALQSVTLLLEVRQENLWTPCVFPLTASWAVRIWVLGGRRTQLVKRISRIGSSIQSSASGWFLQECENGLFRHSFQSGQKDPLVYLCWNGSWRYPWSWVHFRHHDLGFILRLVRAVFVCSFQAVIEYGLKTCGLRKLCLTSPLDCSTFGVHEKCIR